MGVIKKTMDSFFFVQAVKSEQALLVGSSSRPTQEVLPCFLPFLNTQWSTRVWTITQPLGMLELSYMKVSIALACINN